MNYKNNEDESDDTLEMVLDETPTPVEETIRKVIQISFTDDTDEPTISYTQDLNLSQVIGALELTKEILISVNVRDKLHKRRMLQAYQDV